MSQILNIWKAESQVVCNAKGEPKIPFKLLTNTCDNKQALFMLEDGDYVISIKRDFDKKNIEIKQYYNSILNMIFCIQTEMSNEDTLLYMPFANLLPAIRVALEKTQKRMNYACYVK